jgi:Tol biopolymer transport system component
MASGDELGDLEEFSTWRAGARFTAADFNFWGVTFARDSNVFYATLRTAQGSDRGTMTYLVRGDLGVRRLTVLRENVECPSLSPDNRLMAFKKRAGPDVAPWRVYLLDLATLTDRPLAGETRSIDDQIEWLDDTHVLYAAGREKASASRDVWLAPIDNSAPPRIFLSEAESPIVVR